MRSPQGFRQSNSEGATPMQFRDLPPGEEQAFRQWAIEHYVKGQPINPV